MPYTKNAQILVCPSASSISPTGNPPNRGYAINVNICEYNTAKSLAALGDVAGTSLIVDAASFNDAGVISENNPMEFKDYGPNGPSGNWLPPSSFAGNATTGVPNRYLYENPGGSNDYWKTRPVPRHNDGVNVIYCDGHAKWSRADRFLGMPQNGLRGWPYGHANNSWDDK